MAQPQLEWTAHPARERPWTALAVLVAMVVLPAWLVNLCDSFAWSLFASLALLASLHRFFFATFYEITEEGLAARGVFRTRRIRWNDVRRVDVGRFAAWVSSVERPARFEGARGVLVLFGRQRDAVLAELRARTIASAWPGPQQVEHS
jgi:hypothetical protein